MRGHEDSHPEKVREDEARGEASRGNGVGVSEQRGQRQVTGHKKGRLLGALLGGGTGL